MNIYEELRYLRNSLNISETEKIHPFVPAIITGCGFATWHGIVGVTNRVVSFSSAPGFFSTGKALAVEFENLNSVDFHKEFIEITFTIKEKRQNIRFSSITETNPDEWSDLGLMLQLRSLGWPISGVYLEQALEEPLPVEIIKKIFLVLESLKDEFVQTATFLIIRAFILLHLKRFQEAQSLLTKVHNKFFDLRQLFLAEIEFLDNRFEAAVSFIETTPVITKALHRMKILLFLLQDKWLSAYEEFLPHLPKPSKKKIASQKSFLDKLELISDLKFTEWYELHKFVFSQQTEFFEVLLTLFAGIPSIVEEKLNYLKTISSISCITIAKLEAALAFITGNLLRAFRILQNIGSPAVCSALFEIAHRLGFEGELVNFVLNTKTKNKDVSKILQNMGILFFAGRIEEAKKLSEDLQNETLSTPIDKALLLFYQTGIALKTGDLANARILFSKFSEYLQSLETAFQDDLPIWLNEDFQRLRCRGMMLGAEIDIIDLCPCEALVKLSISERFATTKFENKAELEQFKCLKDSAFKLLESESVVKKSELSDFITSNNYRLIPTKNRLQQNNMYKLQKHIENNPILSEFLGEINEMIKNSQEALVIAVIGEFNAGKSTLLNAFLGCDFLPTGVCPTTSVSCLIRYGEKEEARIIYSDGAIETVLPQNLRRYVDERCRSDILADRIVAQVELLLPHEELKEIWFVDTPGLNSIFESHQTATFKLISRADVFILVLDATQIGKASELEITQKLVPQTAKCVFLLNRIDEIEQSEVEEVKAEVARLFKINPTDVIEFCATKAFTARVKNYPEELVTSGFTKFFEIVHEQILKNSWEMKYNSINLRIKSVVEKIRNKWEAEKVRYNNAKDELISSLEKLREEIKLSISTFWKNKFFKIEKVLTDLLKAYSFITENSIDFSTSRFEERLLENAFQSELEKIICEFFPWLQGQIALLLDLWTKTAAMTSSTRTQNGILIALVQREIIAFKEKISKFSFILTMRKINPNAEYKLNFTKNCTKPIEKLFLEFLNEWGDLEFILVNGTHFLIDALHSRQSFLEFLVFGPILRMERFLVNI